MKHGGRCAEKSAAESSPASAVPTHAASAFHLKPEFDGRCARADVVDVNLGHAPEAFVLAAYCQIWGEAPPAGLVELWSGRLRDDAHVRRIDVVRALCSEKQRECALTYSDPWSSHPELLGAPERRTRRDVGAVFMFFFDCPAGVNCGMDWANTHALGMERPHELLRIASDRGVYSPSEVGFWRRELLDAEYAGLQFLLLNTYGPDVQGGNLAPLAKALASLNAPPKIALFDDTWTWGQPHFGPFWQRKPDLADAERAATTLYEAKWKPFYEQVDRRHWYRFKGRPFVYFYDAGTLRPRDRAAAIVARMKARFRSDFGEEPFVDVDHAFFEDPDMPRVADARFEWVTFGLPERRSRSLLNGHVIDHAMVKWDSIGRDRPGDIARPQDRIIKGPELLEQILADSADAELLVLATWNDLGEGTGIHRNYDYYAGGRWLEPDHFMQLIRTSQAKACE